MENRMGKNNRKRRAEKKGKKKLRKNTKPKTQKNNSEGPVFTKLNNPFDGLTNEERTRALAEIAKNAEEQYSKSLEKIRETIRTYDPFVLISILSGYGLTAPIGDGGVKKRDSEYHIHQYHLEFLQALILQTDEANLGKSAFGPDVVQEMWDTLPGLMDAHAFRGINKIDENASEDEKSISMLQHSIRSNTKAVRNWGYFSQVRTISRELYSRLNDLLMQLEGFNADQLITIFEVIVDCIENKHSDRFRTLKSLYNLDSNREVVYAYYDLIGEERSEADRFIHEFDVENTDKKSMFSILMSHYDLRSDETYTFSVDEVLQKSGIERDVIDRVLQYFSHAKGELAETETEYLYLSNPVWSKPLVKLGGGSYFCSIPQVFFSFIMPSIEGIFGNEYKDRVSNTRASYLEDKVAEIIE